MKKLNLAMIATALMFSFGCQKENLTPNDSKSPSSASEDVNFTMKCTPAATTWYWFDNGGTAAFSDYYISPSMIGGPYDFGQIAYPQQNGSADKDKLIYYFEVVNNGNQTDIINLTQYYHSMLSNYVDPCLLDAVINGPLILQMHLHGNIGGGGQFEYLKVMEPNLIDVYCVIPFLLN